MSERRKSAWLVAVVPLVLLGSYVGSYYAMVTPRTDKFQNMIGASKLVTLPRYGLSGESEGVALKRVFAPLHWLDRHIRPRTWGGPIPTEEEWDAFRRQGFPRAQFQWPP